MERILAILQPDMDISQPSLDKAIAVARERSAALTVYVNAFIPALVRALGSEDGRQDRAREAIILAWRKRANELLESAGCNDLDVGVNIGWNEDELDGIMTVLVDDAPDMAVAPLEPAPQGMRRWLMTPLAWKLARYAPCPLLLAGPQAWSTPPVVVASVDPAREHDKPDSLDARIIAQARLLGGADTSALHVVHCLDWPQESLWMLAGEPIPTVAYHDDEKHKHAKLLGTLCQQNRIPPEHCHMLEGRTEKALATYVTDSGADVLVVGAVYRDRLRRTLLGSTAERILGEVDADVLVVKPDGFQTPWHP